MPNVLSVVFSDKVVETGIKCKEPTLTQQNMADECDINKIVKKYEQSGLISHVSQKAAQFGDFSTVPDFQEALNLVHSVNDVFMALPAHVRERFDNDPGKMVAFVQDDNNYEEAAKLGLLEPKKAKGDKAPGGDNTPLKSPEKGLPEDSSAATPPSKKGGKSGGAEQ